MFSLLAAVLLYSKAPPFSRWLELIEAKTYDFQVSKIYQPLSKSPDVLIVGIDDKSLKAEGRLPWSREKMASLIDRLKELDVKVIAIDFLFPTEEPNIAVKVFEKLQKKGEETKDFEYDAMFASSLNQVDCVLGMVLTRNEESVGMLPPPLLTLPNKTLFIPEKNSYLGNIPILQKAAKNGGFINSTPDPDAIIRFSPLVYSFGLEVFGSLSLVAVREFLNAKTINLIAKPYQKMDFLEAIELDQRSIPVDNLGRILVPYRGPAYTFPQLSATDVLHNRVPKDAVQGKLVFIGATATGSGDLVATPMSRSYNGVEIHATIAQSIIDGYLPFKPSWEKGVSVALVLFLGIVLSLLLPRLGPISMLFISVGCTGLLFFLDYWVWSHETMVLSFFVPILVIGILFLFNTIYGFIAEAKQRQTIKNIFGQYVSSEHIDLILKEGLEIKMKGESKDLTVLFSDIRGFTALSENMSATELTAFLNEYFTSMTEVIFQNQGTIDKYIGDAIMAFWGAPIEDSANSYHAIKAALRMQETLDGFNRQKGSSIHIGAGIATGNMFVGDMGSKFRRSYTVMGDTVNLSSRLEGLTKHYGAKVIVSEATYLATRDHFLYRKLDKVQVKGKKVAVSIYEPICSIEEADPNVEKEIDLHSKALEAYCKGDWELARRLWSQLNNQFYAMYLERMPPGSQPGPNWDGVQKYESK